VAIHQLRLHPKVCSFAVLFFWKQLPVYVLVTIRLLIFAESPAAQDSVRDCILISLIRSFTRLVDYSENNLDKLSRKSDVTSACLSQFADVLGSNKDRWKRKYSFLFTYQSVNSRIL